MSKNFEKLSSNWNQLLLQMKEDFEISDHVFQAFIKDILKPVKLEKNTLYIEVPEEGYISFLQNRILSQLRISVSHETGISTEDLEAVLINEDGGYSSPEARLIDEQIFFYVPKRIAVDCSDEEAAEFVHRHLN